MTHPSLPADLSARALPIKAFRGAWWRVHRMAFAPIHYGKGGGNRFDSPDGSFGVLYVARHERGAFVETFGHGTGVRVLDQREIEIRGLARVDTSRPLRLVDLRAEGLARIGADAELLAGPYDVSQAWSHALHDHRSVPDGIVYRARHDPSQTCAAIFERAANVVHATTLGAFSDPALVPLLAKLLDVYDFGIA